MKSEPPKGATLLNCVVIVVVSDLYVFDVVESIKYLKETQIDKVLQRQRNLGSIHLYSKTHLIENFELHTGKLSHLITKHLNFVLI